MTLLNRRMTAKVFLAIGIGVGFALLLQARYETRNEARTIKRETRIWADRIADLFVGAVEHSMLRGDGITVSRALCVIDRESGGGAALADIGIALDCLFTMAEIDNAANP